MLSPQQEETHKQATLLFYSDQNAGSIARDFKTSAMSLRKWWISAFGKAAVQYVESGNLPLPSIQKIGSIHLYTEHPERVMVKSARGRAKEHGVPFDIKAKDIRACFPKDGCCPITRQPFERGEGKCGPQSMSLDRIIPELGYVPGNIAVISHLANTIKQNCTDPEVFRRIASYLEAAQELPLRKVG
jgi:hypothetical protein